MRALNIELCSRLREKADEYMRVGEYKYRIYLNAASTLITRTDITADDVRNKRVTGKWIGPKIQEHLIEYLDNIEEKPAKIQNYNVHKHYLTRLGAIEKIKPLLNCLTNYEITGSYRRGCKEVGDIDIIVFGKFPDLSNFDEYVTAKGTKKIKFDFKDIEVDLRSFDEERAGTALLYFTGPRNFNLWIRGIAKSKGEKLNEYGITELSTGTERVFDNEPSVFSYLGLDYVSPENREYWR